MSSNKFTSSTLKSSYVKKPFTHVLYYTRFNLSSGNLKGGWAFNFVINLILKIESFPSKSIVGNTFKVFAMFKFEVQNED